MKIMSLIFLAFIFIQCASISTGKKIPFTIDKASYKESSKNIQIDINYTATSSIDFLNIYFKNHKIKLTKNNNTSLSATYNKSVNFDIQLHRNSKKEFGNHPQQKVLPFKLKEEEAMLSYKERDTIKYFKLKKVEARK